jgi:UrcA family protein
MAADYPKSPDFAVAAGYLGTKPSFFGTNTSLLPSPFSPSKRLIYTNNQPVEESCMSNFKSFVLLAASAVASVGTVGVAAAADAQLTSPKMVLHFKPEDLNSEEGVQKVYLQIKAAAENVCPAVATGTFLPSEGALKCRRAAVASAVESIHNKRLAEVASASKFG